MITAFGVVSLGGDMVYEGMRSAAGPLLASLGASAFVVGLVTGAGEAMALVLRLVAGPLADRHGAYWGWAITGYAMTAVAVPLLAVTPFIGAAGLAVASALILLERTGKAVRSPAKSALLADVAAEVGRGRGIAVHKMLDQIGAVAGPLVVAAGTGLTAELWPGLAVLAVPGAVAVVLLLRTRARMPVEPGTTGATPITAAEASALPARFHVFAVSCGLATAGLMTYGVISFHLVHERLVGAGWVPVVYALAMLTAAGAALVTGFAYDRWHGRVLLALPVLVAVAGALVFGDRLALVVLGVALWGMASGVQDSTVKALVADLVARPRLGTAYGVFAAYQGVAALAGGAVAGALYADHRGPLVTGIVVAQLVALALLARVTGRTGH